ncbi:MAG: UDP-3-O-(3-hydroxymyristoyl)glucosamine N-acyltransferase [Candidatus Eisenbacteria bacterium]|uniref:UDP-3-O-acylglucosamine N-acyltransferase n=1 Tax=Eiseniibacteriota bacterium TaxID=2212470 RepID=A0A849SE11_UNCEI|nr:UDP-3-O-(3-hydroxymyristoyl)glucosamine N-acyltransferase [Candidatus Eisenbacteria bacterium]
MTHRTLAELAAELGGEVVGDGSIEIRDVAGIKEAEPGDITFLANSRYDAYLDETRASAVICVAGTRSAGKPLLLVANPYLAYQRLVRIFRPHEDQQAKGVHVSAVVAPDVVLGADVSIGPHCIVDAGAVLGARVTLMGGCVVGPRVTIGDETLLWPHVVVREDCRIGARCIFHPGVVIGSDGFGFALDGGRYHKVPQVGNVVIGDDVEIGANSTVDRATTHSTMIGNGTKIDNLVQIGHNVVIGEHGIVVAQVGISGSTVLGDYVTVAGQAGIAGHLTIGKGAVVAGKSGVTQSVPAGATVSGYPAISHSAWKRIAALLQRLPLLFQRARALEERVEKLEKQQSREEVS